MVGKVTYSSLDRRVLCVAKKYAAMNLDIFYNAEGLEKEGKREEAISAYSDFITDCRSCETDADNTAV